MGKIANSSKEAIIGLRRKNQTRATIGGLLYQMVEQKKCSISGVKNICSLIHTDPRRLKYYLGFRIYPQGRNENHILHLGSDDITLITKVKNIYNEFKTLTQEEQNIAQYVFFHLIKND